MRELELSCLPLYPQLPAHGRYSQLIFLECLLCARHYFKPFLFMNSFHKPSELGSTLYNHPHFTDREMRVSKGMQVWKAHRCQCWDGNPASWHQSPRSHPRC